MKALVLSCALLLCATFAQAQVQSANLKTVMDNYARFGQGDIPGILATLAGDAVWIHPGNPGLVPFAGTYVGPAGVGQFFEKVSKSVQITVFQPANFREEGNMVSNDVHIEGTVIATGKPYSSDVVMNWAFGPDGKATRWEAVGDVSSLEAASAR